MNQIQLAMFLDNMEKDLIGVRLKTISRIKSRPAIAMRISQHKARSNLSKRQRDLTC